MGENQLLMQKRIPELLASLETIYSLDYNIGYLQQGYEIAQPYLVDFWIFLQAEIEKFDRPLRILEIGCGGAILLERLKALGHKVVGVDPSPLSARAREELGLDIHLEMLNPNMEIGVFDLIYSMDVLEHAFDPREFLEVSRGYLSEGGRIVASVPDAGPSINLNEVSCAMHQHLQYFNSATLEALLRSLEFNQVDVTSAGYGGSLYVSAGYGSNSDATEPRHEPRSAGVNSSPDIPTMELNFLGVTKYLREVALSGKSLGIYAPLRALPYLAPIEHELIESSFRFIDDTVRWHQRRFDGCPVPVENFSDVVSNPPDEFLVFSLTFENVMRDKISAAGFGNHTQSLRELLN
jgi:SAM-dependent methyltransferase